MQKLDNLNPSEVFKYFEQLTKIPRESGNMQNVCEYCVNFAKKHSLKFIKDNYNNVVIFKKASVGYEDAEPVILQSHLDMVCQKDIGREFDFKNNAIDIYVDGDFIKANGTTLGADDGIGVAMMLAILSNDNISHPPIEAVFTSDEEIGMIGASNISFNNLKGKRMINLDSGDEKTVTVSCAGGSDFKMVIPISREKRSGTSITFSVNGLKGGHSGVEINNNSINANILLGRILYHMKKILKFSIIGINGGDKGNAIPVTCTAEIFTEDKNLFISALEEYAKVIKGEISDREEGFNLRIKSTSNGEFDVMDDLSAEKIIFTLLCVPNGVQEMSATIDNLVETSLNLGILKTNSDTVQLLFTLRSNKTTSLEFLEERLITFVNCIKCKFETGGHYPPWEFNNDSRLLSIYKALYEEKFRNRVKTEAIHAGLECGVFSAGINNFDCISIGPNAFDIHTTRERLSISSTKNIYELILKLLENLR